jgi:hypothetical protein
VVAGMEIILKHIYRTRSFRAMKLMCALFGSVARKEALKGLAEVR